MFITILGDNWSKYFAYEGASQLFKDQGLSDAREKIIFGNNEDDVSRKTFYNKQIKKSLFGTKIKTKEFECSESCKRAFQESMK